MSAIKHIARLLIPLAVLLMAMDTPLEAAQTYENHVSWSPPKVMYAVERSNVRAGPGTSYDKVDLLEVGQEVRVSERTGSWFKLEDRAGQVERFVYAPLLTATKLTAATIRNFSFPDGARYRGHARDGKPHGRGVYSWANGDRYVGNFVNGKRTGRGVHTWANGDRYEGEFVNGKRTGRGVYSWANGDHYEGEFVNGKLHGRGVYALANGDRYEGVFVDGKRIDAQETWIAYVPGLGECTHYEGPPYHSVCPSMYGISWGWRSKGEALKAAKEECETGPVRGRECGRWAETDAWRANCISVAEYTYTYTYGGWGPYSQTNHFAAGATKRLEAEREALTDCRNSGAKRCRIVETRCTK